MTGSEIKQLMGVVDSVKHDKNEIVAKNHQKARLCRGQTGTFIFTITNNTQHPWSPDSKLVPAQDCRNYKGLSLALQGHEVRTLRVYVTPTDQTKKKSLSLKFFFQSKTQKSNFGEELAITVDVVDQTIPSVAPPQQQMWQPEDQGVTEMELIAMAGEMADIKLGTFEACL